MDKKTNLKVLGVSKAKFQGLETFPAPEAVREVTCTSDEVTAVCPVTGQPDWYQVRISYRPDKKCVESKSLKLYLHTFRNKGHFCERFAHIIADEFFTAIQPVSVTVTVTQKPRGGIAIESVAAIDPLEEL